MSSAVTPATAKESSEALIQDCGVKCSAEATSSQSEAHQLTVPGLTSWYVAKPAAQGSTSCQRPRAVSLRSHAPRRTTK